MIKVKPKIQQELPDIKYFCKYVADTRNNVSRRFFAGEFGRIKNAYLRNGQEDTFCFETDRLADRLMRNNNFDFVGIIMSALCKINENLPHNLEYFAKKGYAASCQNGDFIHAVARLNDLKRIYMGNPRKRAEYLQVLYKQEQFLQEMVQNYTGTVSSFCTIKRAAAPKDTYEQMLAYTKTEISKLTYRSNPREAMTKLNRAMQIFKKADNTHGWNYATLIVRNIAADTAAKIFKT